MKETACRTQALPEQMQSSGCTISIVTKSNLVPLCDATFPKRIAALAELDA